jgi:hypothetical protein
VDPRIPVPFDAQAQPEYEPGTEKILAELRDKLPIPAGVEAHFVALRRDPARELIAFADQEGIELIATDSRGFSTFTGSLIGRVTTALQPQADDQGKPHDIVAHLPERSLSCPDRYAIVLSIVLRHDVRKRASRERIYHVQ